MTTTTIERNPEVLDEQDEAVVEEFAKVLRSHTGQKPVKLAQLANRAFQQVLSVKTKSREIGLAVASMRGLEVKQKLMEAEGGSLSSEEVARMLGISKTAVLKRLEKGKLLAWREERLQAARFPKWQFDEHGQTLKGIDKVLACLSSNPHLDVWAKVMFFLQNKGVMDGRRPLDLLREGNLDKALLAAEAYAE